MNADRLLDHYERIADAPDAIPRLRRFILDLAVRGKLVAQDPNDEPAAELLKRIAKEKARLVKKGELRQQKPPKLGDVNVLPFELMAGSNLSMLLLLSRFSSSCGQDLLEVRFTRATIKWAAFPWLTLRQSRMRT